MSRTVTGVTNVGYCCGNAGCAHDMGVGGYGKNSSKQNTELALKAFMAVHQCSLGKGKALS